VRPHMHEKVLIIDGEVLWHGSLNLLASSGPTDLMMRITSRGSCDRVRQIMARARSEKASTPRSNTTQQDAKTAAQVSRKPVSAKTTRDPARRTNKYDALCAVCGRSVPANSGELIGKGDDGRWAVRCNSCPLQGA